MINPAISVVMSVYNGEPYLSKAIESILKQTYQNFEFIIINDGSIDNSWETIKRYADKDTRITPITQENIGLTKSLNKGIQLSEGKYIARQDADDISLPCRLERQLFWLEEKEYDLCCSRTWLLSSQRPTPRWSYWIPKGLMMLKQNPFVHGSYLMRKEPLAALGGYDEGFRYAQDYELMTRWLLAGLRMKYLRECLYQTRQPADSISINYRSEQQEFGKKVRRFWRQQVMHSPRLLFRWL